MTSPIQLRQGNDSTWTVNGLDASRAQVETMQDDEPPFDWLAALEIPKDWHKISAMAVPSGLSQRWLRFVVCDESVTRLPGAYRFQPPRLTFKPSGQLLTLSHLGFAIGVTQYMNHGTPGEVEHVEGAYILGVAELFSSLLADAAWRGLQEEIFQFVSPVVVRQASEPAGTGEILEVGITDRPCCPGARILKAWDIPPVE